MYTLKSYVEFNRFANFWTERQNQNVNSEMRILISLKLVIRSRYWFWPEPLMQMVKVKCFKMFNHFSRRSVLVIILWLLDTKESRAPPPNWLTACLPASLLINRLCYRYLLCSVLSFNHFNSMCLTMSSAKLCVFRQPFGSIDWMRGCYESWVSEFIFSKLNVSHKVKCENEKISICQSKSWTT